MTDTERIAALEAVVAQLAERAGVAYAPPRVLVDCDDCAGTGVVITESAELTCVRCGGSGKVAA